MIASPNGVRFQCVREIDVGNQLTSDRNLAPLGLRVFQTPVTQGCRPGLLNLARFGAFLTSVPIRFAMLDQSLNDALLFIGRIHPELI